MCSVEVGWPSVSVRREQHCMVFIYKALLHVWPVYLSNFSSFRTCNLHSSSQEPLIINIPTVRTELGKSAFQVCAPQKWNDLQCVLELSSYHIIPHIAHISRHSTYMSYHIKPHITSRVWSDHITCHIRSYQTSYSISQCHMTYTNTSRLAVTTLTTTSVKSCLLVFHFDSLMLHTSWSRSWSYNQYMITLLQLCHSSRLALLSPLFLL